MATDMRIVAKRIGYRTTWLSFESRHLVLQILPNPFVQIGSVDLAIDRDGVLISWATGHCGYIRGSGFHHGRP